ncbi:ChaN family lipoprotein [Limnohabitans sp. DCL3]|uniref:ChaN family lipoprotein n=1 Tax=Limnohabitans sp. DCL3 TaxID=3374103 RepID=UPI003A8BB204
MNHVRIRLHQIRCSSTALAFALCSTVLAAESPSQDVKTPQDGTRIFFLGEIHDNEHGHQRRLERVKQLIEQGPLPVVAMEQFDRENQAVLDAALSQCPDVDCVLAKAGTTGWAWRFYKPYVQWALDKKIKLVAANMSNVDVRKVMTNGFESVLGAQLVDTYQLKQIPAQLLTAQNKAIQEGHCNMLPAQAIGPMVQGQIARDVWMAHVVNDVSDAPVVLIAGNGHVRKDAGVMRWLTPQNQAKTQVHGYVEKTDQTDAQWYDHVHVVPRVEREDACLVFTQNRASKPTKKQTTP